MRDPDDVIFATERTDDLGRGRQQETTRPVMELVGLVGFVGVISRATIDRTIHHVNTAAAGVRIALVRHAILRAMRKLAG